MRGFIDTHCHLDDIVTRLKLSGYAELKSRFFPPEYAGCLTISCDPDSIEPILAFLREDGVYGAFGIHPHESKGYTPEVAERIGLALEHPKCAAYGEMGLDYHYDYSPRETQREVFARQIEVGIRAKKPLVIHTREAEADTLAALRQHVPKGWPMHVHCFTSSPGMAEALLADFPNLFLGFTGIVTFRNAGDVRETARLTPLERMLAETDGPYLAPEPHRGQTAHPGHIPLIVAKLAEIKGKTAEETGARLFENARKFYGMA